MHKAYLTPFWFGFFVITLTAAVVANTTRKPLPPLEAQLYRYIVNTQISHHPNPRYLGGWRVTAKSYQHPDVSFQGSNIFIPLQIMISLKKLQRSYNLPHFNQMASLFDQMLRAYIQDAAKLGEPLGTIAFWPLLKQQDGSYKRNFTSDPDLLDLVDGLDIANDLDDSSQMAIWHLLRGTGSDFVESFVKLLSSYVDVGRERQTGREDQWKPNNSGAYFTWVHNWPDRNNVDCVVNLNILNSLKLYRVFNGAITDQEVLNSKQNSCRILSQAIQGGSTAKCAIYYDHFSQFALALSKSTPLKESCFDIVTQDIFKSQFLAEITAIDDLGGLDMTRTAELLIALKKFFPPTARDAAIMTKIQKLSKHIKQNVKISEQGYYYLEGGNLFNGQFSTHLFHWYSPAQTTTLGLEALLTP